MRLLFFNLAFLLSISIFSQSITITSPNGGEFYNANSSQNVTWNTTGSVGLMDLYYTTDNGVNWTLYASGINSASGSFAWTIPNNPSNVCLIRLEAGVIADTSDAVFSISFNNNALTIGTPNGGEIYTGGSNQNITWSTSGPVASLQLFYSSDNGANWTLIASGISAFSGSYSWTVPNISSTNCLVRLTDGIATDESNATFTINGLAAGSITVLNPNGGESMFPGNNFNITWTTAGVVNPLSIYYSIDGGSNWALISSGETGNSYIWQVPNAPSSDCLIRLEDGILADNSDAVFTINPDPTTITLTSPNGGEVLQGFDTFNITWDTVTNSYIDSVEISFKENISFAPYFTTVKNTGSYIWSVPNVMTANAKINVKLQGYLLQDSSDMAFSINPISIQLINPNGGEILVGGDAYQINWLQTGNFSGVDVYQSLDSGSTYSIIASGVVDTFYVWNTPNFDTTNCIIKIDYNGLLTDTSDIVFSIAYTDISDFVNEHTSNYFNVFPNPSSGLININLTNKQSIVTYIAEVYDLNGKVIASFQNERQLDLSQFANGIYWLRIVSGNSPAEILKVVLAK